MVTLDTFKQYLWITGADQDELLTIFLNWAVWIIEWYIGRSITNQTYTDIVNGTAQVRYVLKNYPVVAFTSVERNIWNIDTPDWEAVTDYHTDMDCWVVEFYSPIYKWLWNYKFKYEAWYTTFPADLLLATLKIWSMLYRLKDSDGISSESVAGDSISFMRDTLPQDILIALDRYKKL